MTKRHILMAVSVQNEPRIRSVPDKTPPDTTPVFHLPPFVVAANKNGIIFRLLLLFANLNTSLG